MKISVFFHHVLVSAKEQGCSIGEVLDQIHALGATMVEVDRQDVGRGIGAAEDLKILLNRHGMGVSSIYDFYEWDRNPEDIHEDLQLRMAEVLGAEKMMIIPGFYTLTAAGSTDESIAVAEKQKKKEFEQMLESTKTLSRRAAEAGIIPIIEDFDDERSPIGTTAQIQKFLTEIPELAFTLDTGNFMFHGEDVLTAMGLFKNRMKHVHFKDHRVLTDEENHTMKTVEKFALGECKNAVDGTGLYPCAIGDGCVPIETVLDRLKESQYDGVVAIEHFCVPNYTESLKRSLQWVTSKL